MLLFGGGFSAAVVQLVVFYYTAACIMHFVVPRLLPVKSIQKAVRGRQDVWRDALFSLGVPPTPNSTWARGALHCAQGKKKAWTQMNINCSNCKLCRADCCQSLCVECL